MSVNTFLVYQYIKNISHESIFTSKYFRPGYFSLLALVPRATFSRLRFPLSERNGGRAVVVERNVLRVRRPYVSSVFRVPNGSARLQSFLLRPVDRKSNNWNYIRSSRNGVCNAISKYGLKPQINNHRIV